MVIAIVLMLALNVAIWRAVLGPVRLVPATAAPKRSPVAALPTRAATATAPASATPARQNLPIASPSAARGRTPTPSPTVRATPSPTAAPTVGLLTSVEQIDEAVAAGRHGVPYRLVLSQQEINDTITAYLSGTGDVTFSEIRVRLEPGVAIITGKARVLAFNVGFTARTTVVIENGRPRLKVLGLDVFGGLLPGFIKDRLIQLIEQQADLPLLDNLPVTIDSVELQTGQAVATGVVI